MTTDLFEHRQLAHGAGVLSNNTSRPPMRSLDASHGLSDPRAIARGADQWAHAWFTMVRHPWSSLVLVPVEPTTSSLAVANRLAVVGLEYHDEPINVVDAESLASKDLAELLSQIDEQTRSGARVLIAVPPPLTHYSAVPIARSADAAVLLVAIGRTRFAQARRTIECVGAASFIGSVTIGR